MGPGTKCVSSGKPEDKDENQVSDPDGAKPNAKGEQQDFPHGDGGAHLVPKRFVDVAFSAVPFQKRHALCGGRRIANFSFDRGKGSNLNENRPKERKDAAKDETMSGPSPEEPVANRLAQDHGPESHEQACQGDGWSNPILSGVARSACLRGGRSALLPRANQLAWATTSTRYLIDLTLGEEAKSFRLRPLEALEQEGLPRLP